MGRNRRKRRGARGPAHHRRAGAVRPRAAADDAVGARRWSSCDRKTRVKQRSERASNRPPPQRATRCVTSQLVGAADAWELSICEAPSHVRVEITGAVNDTMFVDGNCDVAQLARDWAQARAPADAPFLARFVSAAASAALGEALLSPHLYVGEAAAPKHHCAVYRDTGPIQDFWRRQTFGQRRKSVHVSHT
mmetsp:Transcript_4277/g.15696  ORF Transcript_4277/g.15696 Transcript_4277/m.15696 type:complete len:192 (+) Transcript_4277:796-1371(+)